MNIRKYDDGTGLDVTFKQISEKMKKSDTEDIPIEEQKGVSSVGLQDPTIKENRIRLCLADWQRIVEEARRLYTSHTALAHALILDGLNKHNQH